MFRGCLPILAIVAGLFLTSDVHAGWVVIKNETKQAIVVVEIAGTPNKPIQGKPVKLQPGEVYREFQAAAGQKTFAIYDAAKLNAPLAQQAIAWPAEDACFGIRSDGKTVKLIADSSKK